MICVVSCVNFFAVVADVVTELTRRGLLIELLYADKVGLISETSVG